MYFKHCYLSLLFRCVNDFLAALSKIRPVLATVNDFEAHVIPESSHYLRYKTEPR